MSVKTTEPFYSRHRDDGWPLCPGCGEDELWSAATEPTTDTIVSCLRCGWKPGYYELSVAGRRDLSDV
jgi:hypothetical protein